MTQKIQDVSEAHVAGKEGRFLTCGQSPKPSLQNNSPAWAPEMRDTCWDGLSPGMWVVPGHR